MEKEDIFLTQEYTKDNLKMGIFIEKDCSLISITELSMEIG